MVECNAVQAILNARQKKYYTLFSSVEFDYISSRSDISHVDKLVWLQIAKLSSMDSNLCCSATHSQIAEKVGVKPDTVYRSIRKLKEKGYLQVELNAQTGINVYTLCLPQEGVAEVNEAPVRGGEGATIKAKVINFPVSTTTKSSHDKAPTRMSVRGTPRMYIRCPPGSRSAPYINK